MEPIKRRDLLEVGVGAALGLSIPASAREIDPELVSHWTNLLNLLGRHDAMFGPREVLTAVRREIGLIAEHRAVARGDLRTELMHVEARWTAFAAWLSNDTGLTEDRDAWTERSRLLAQEAGYRDMAAFARMRQSQWASQDQDAATAIKFAELALRVPGASPQTRALCALRAALGHALAQDADSCERRLSEAYNLVERESLKPPWAGESVTQRHVRVGEARCWIWLKPIKAIPLYEGVLKDWPRDRMRDGGLHRIRLAVACAMTGEQDRAEAEGRRALVIARATKSKLAARELQQLGSALNGA